MSSSEVGVLLLEIGAALGRSPEQMAPIIQKLVEEEWYDTIASLQTLSEEKWAILPLPKRLLDELRMRVAEVGTPNVLPPVSESSSIPALVPIPPPTGSAKMELVPDSNSLPSPVPMENIFSEISTSHEPPSVYLQCLLTLATLIGNILSDPEEEKFRLLRSTNAKFAKAVGRWNSAREVLRSIGFHQNDDDGNGLTWRCPTVYFSRLTDVYQSIALAIEKTGLAPRPTLPNSAVFNPFQASIANSGATFGAPTGRLAQERMEEQNRVRNEVSELRKLHQKGTEESAAQLTPPRLVRIGQPTSVEKDEKKSSSWSKSKKKLASSIFKKTNKKESSDDEETDAGLLLSNLRSITAAAEGAQKFQSREKLELERLRARPTFGSAIVRIAFFDKCYLEVPVAPTETVGSVYSIFTECLNQEFRGRTDWELTVTPPLRKLSRTSKLTMIQEQFVPSVTMRIMLAGQQCSATQVLSSKYLN